MYRRGAGAARQTTQEITGYVVVQADQNNESDDDSDVDEDDDWLDDDQMSAMSMGGTLVKRNSAKNQRVTIKQILEGGKSYVCKGQFPLVDPWWKVTCHIYQGNRQHVFFVDHTRPIKYEIRKDEDVIRHKLMNMFISKVTKPHDDSDMQEKRGTAFEQFVRDNGYDNSLYFENFENYYQQFDDESTRYQVNSIWPLIRKSEQVRLLQAVVDFPELFQFLGQLRPKQFLSIFENVGAHILRQLDSCRQEYPWEFGFSSIMYKQYGLIGMEASLNDFVRCRLLTSFPTVYQDALNIYDFLKKDARENGHTYIEKFRMKMGKFFNDYRVVKWEEALKYLEQHAIIKSEGKDRQTKIYLKRNWQAEKDVAKHLSDMINNEDNRMGHWDVDFTSEDFDNLYGDSDQWRAVHLITQNPVAVLSGKGGCGKTTVVTQLLKHICTKSHKIETENKDDTLDKTGADNSNQTLDESSILQENETSFDQPIQYYKSPWKSQKEMMNSTLRNGDHDDSDENEDDSDDEDVHYLSKTPVGETILLTAPTGKAANLLGRKACMESFTLHHVIMSYKGFCKRKADYFKEKGLAGNQDNNNDDDGSDDDEKSQRNATNFVNEKSGGTNQNGKSKKYAKDFGDENSDGLNEHEEGLKNGVRDVDSEMDATQNSENVLGNEARYPNNDPEMPRWKFENKSVLVVDECSLVSVRTIATVLNNLKRLAGLRKIILLGDVRQLPSVEPGNFLCDIFHVLSPLGCCMELRTNHRSESELIVKNATKISQMKLPDYDNRKFCLLEIGFEEGDNEIDAQIRHLLKTSNLDQETSQFVCFQRRRCESINELCCKFYNDHITKDDRKRYLFRQGDKVCMSKNAEIINYRSRLPSKKKPKQCDSARPNGSQTISQSTRSRGNVRNGFSSQEAADFIMEDTDKELLPVSQHSLSTQTQKKKKEKKNKNVRLCNGEVFFIIHDVSETSADGKTIRYITLTDKEEPKEKMVCVNYRDLIKKCKMRHGWARTIHTYQGSESTAVVYVVYRSFYENWQHVYTAVTRGRCSVYMVGKKCNIDRAITTSHRPRRTSLKEKLLDNVQKFPEILQTLQEDLDTFINNSTEERNQKQVNNNGVAETWGEGDDDWDDEYMDALCELLPSDSDSEKEEDNSNCAKGSYSVSSCIKGNNSVTAGFVGNSSAAGSTKADNYSSSSHKGDYSMGSDEKGNNSNEDYVKGNNSGSNSVNKFLSSDGANTSHVKLKICETMDTSNEFSKDVENTILRGDNYISKGDNCVSKEDNSDSFFDSDDSYIKTLDESGLILQSQLAASNQFAKYRTDEPDDEDEKLFDSDKSYIRGFDDSNFTQITNRDTSVNVSFNSDEDGSHGNIFKRQLSAATDYLSPTKSQRIQQSSEIVSPVRRNLQNTML
ncbi:DNA helicase B [Patella vulgata]|uniref:DNA helicase B n=1 Tax=Patella vulgata TaxID=6465 RepID=UPI0024A8EBD0|nr:DNA helicase B [Patella vulgata]